MCRFLAIALFVIPVAAEVTVHYSYELSEGKMKKIAAWANSQREIVKELIYGNGVKSGVNPLDCVDQVVTKVSRFYKDHDEEMRLAKDRIIQKIKQKTEGLVKDILKYNKLMADEILILEAAISSLLKHENTFNVGLEYTKLDKQRYEKEIKYQLSTLKNEWVPLLKNVAVFYQQDLGRRDIGPVDQNGQVHNGKESGEIDVIEAELYVPKYPDMKIYIFSQPDPEAPYEGNSVIEIIENCVEELGDIRNFVHDVLTKKKGNSRIKSFNESQKINDALNNARISIQKFRKHEKEQLNLRNDHKKNITDATREMSSNFLNAYWMLMLLLRDDSNKIQELGEKIGKIENKYTIDIGNKLTAHLTSFADDLSKIIDSKDMHWMILKKKIGQIARPLFYNNNWYNQYNKVAIDELSIWLDKDEHNKRVLRNVNCKVYLMYFSASEEAELLPSRERLYPSPNDIPIIVSPATKHRMDDDGWNTQFTAVTTDMNQVLVDGSGNESRSLFSEDCHLYLLGDNSVRLTLFVNEYKYSYVFLDPLSSDKKNALLI